MRAIKYILILALVFVFSGCLPIKEVPYPTIYTIKVPTIAKSGKKIEKSIKVKLPKVKPSLMSKEIHYVKNGNEISSYNKSILQDKPSVIFYEVIYKALLNSNLFSNIISQNSFAKSDLVLESMVFDMYHEIGENNSSKFHLDIGFDLIDTNKRVTISSKRFVYNKECEANAKSAIETLTKEIDLLSNDLIAWLKDVDYESYK